MHKIQFSRFGGIGSKLARPLIFQPLRSTFNAINAKTFDKGMRHHPSEQRYIVHIYVEGSWYVSLTKYSLFYSLQNSLNESLKYYKTSTTIV